MTLEVNRRQFLGISTIALVPNPFNFLDVATPIARYLSSRSVQLTGEGLGEINGQS